jgi:uncharacterized membrane protein YeaQ/YmgE (transglycosylase-associated protein family)
MRATDPVVTFVLILVIGIVAGILFDRLAGPSWLARRFAGSTRGITTSSLVGIAGAFVGYHIAVLLALGGGLVTSVIAAAVGAAVVLYGGAEITFSAGISDRDRLRGWGSRTRTQKCVLEPSTSYALEISS